MNESLKNYIETNILPLMEIRMQCGILTNRRNGTSGILATAGMPCRRVSITFSDRSVMKSTMHLEISPNDRDGFMNQLKEINLNIEEKQ